MHDEYKQHQYDDTYHEWELIVEHDIDSRKVDWSNHTAYSYCKIYTSL